MNNAAAIPVNPAAVPPLTSLLLLLRDDKIIIDISENKSIIKQIFTAKKM
jgi:hypothetical protein